MRTRIRTVTERNFEVDTEARTELDNGTLKLHFTQPNLEVDALIYQLIGMTGGIHHPEMIRDMIVAALKAGQENSQKAYLKIMTSTLKELRYTAKVFNDYTGIKKVTMFGSARVQSDAATYQMARALGHKLAEAGYMVITGAGRGIMQAGNEGAGAEHSFGVGIRLPFESEPNHVLQGSLRSISYKYFFNRKVAFVKEADAVALFPGGFGTMDEAMEVLTLVQTGKRYPIPLVLVDEPGGTYWSSWKEYMEKEMVPRGYIDPGDLGLFHLVDSVDDAVEIIDRFYRRYHSLRFVDGRLVIRMSSPVDEECARRWKMEFQDILEPLGDLFLSEALPEESDEPQIAHLPRLVLDFNRRHYFRLIQLIDAINVA